MWCRFESMLVKNYKKRGATALVTLEGKWSETWNMHCAGGM